MGYFKDLSNKLNQLYKYKIVDTYTDLEQYDAFYETFNILEINKYDNSQIARVFTYTIEKKMDMNNQKLNGLMIVSILKHIEYNIYNTPNYYQTQVFLVNCLFVYMLKSDEPLIDSNTHLFIRNINWNNDLYIYMLNLLSAANKYHCFVYIYELMNNDTYVPNLIHFLSNYSAKMIRGNINCYSIFTFLLDRIVSDKLKTQLINNHYENIISIERITNENKITIYLNDTNQSYKINTNFDQSDNNNNIYKYLDKITCIGIKDKIIKSAICCGVSNREIFDNMISYLDIDTNEYITYALEYMNYYYLDNYINYKKLSPSLCYKILLNIKSMMMSSYDNDKKILNLVNKIIKMGFVNSFTFTEMKCLMIKSINSYNLIIMNKLFPLFKKKYESEVKFLFKYCNIELRFHNLMRLVNHYKIDITFNDSMIDIYAKNYCLVAYLKKKKILTDDMSKKICKRVLQNRSNMFSGYIIRLTLPKIFDAEICKLLYDKRRYRNMLCKYLVRCREHKYNYSDIQKNYPYIIHLNKFAVLIRYLNITKEDANDILVRLKKCRNFDIVKFVIDNIIKINI